MKRRYLRQKHKSANISNFMPFSVQPSIRDMQLWYMYNMIKLIYDAQVWTVICNLICLDLPLSICYRANPFMLTHVQKQLGQNV